MSDAGLLPQKRKKNKQLLDMLTADGGSETSQNPLFAGQRRSQDGSHRSPNTREGLPNCKASDQVWGILVREGEG